MTTWQEIKFLLKKTKRKRKSKKMITKENKIKKILPKGYELDGNICYTTNGERERLEIDIKKKEKTPEQLANELGFEFEDKCWDERKNYYGRLKGVISGTDESDLIVKCENDTSYLKYLTNKVAIHCPIKEDFEFICKQLNKKFTNSFNNLWVNDGTDDMWLLVNNTFNGDKEWNQYITNPKAIEAENYLVLTVDEYCQSQGIKPLFVTKDGKNIYEGMDYYYYFTVVNYFIRNKAIPDGLYTIYETFSTEEAGQQYLVEQIAIQWLADEFQVLKLDREIDRKGYSCVPTSPLGKIFDNDKDAYQYHAELLAENRGIKIGTKLFYGIKGEVYGKYLGKADKITAGSFEYKCTLHVGNNGYALQNVVTAEELE